MRTGDDRRREIVAAIHACGRDDLHGMSFQKRLAQLCGVEGATWRQTMHAVADLIEPQADPCWSVAGEGEGDRFRCSACGVVWELTNGSAGGSGVRHCPGCGRRIVHARVV